MNKFIEEKLCLFEIEQEFEHDEQSWRDKKYKPSDALCEICFRDLPLTLAYWYPSALRFIEEFYEGKHRCRRCTDLNSKISGRNRRTRKPKWANADKMKLIYDNCPEGYEVDHIVPLLGKNVCGLHVENNLQYLPTKENRKKSNKF